MPTSQVGPCGCLAVRTADHSRLFACSSLCHTPCWLHDEEHWAGRLHSSVLQFACANHGAHRRRPAAGMLSKQRAALESEVKRYTTGELGPQTVGLAPSGHRTRLAPTIPCRLACHTAKCRLRPCVHPRFAQQCLASCPSPAARVTPYAASCCRARGAPWVGPLEGGRGAAACGPDTG